MEYSDPLPLLGLPCPLQPTYYMEHPDSDAAFTALMQYFDTAARHPRVWRRISSNSCGSAAAATFAADATNAGALPDELVLQVMRHADWRT